MSYIGIELFESHMEEHVSDLVAKATKEVFDEFIQVCREKIKDKKNLSVILDAGWSHPGWWARECTIICLNQDNGLPIAVKHVKKGENYEGSSKGMEGFGVQEIMKELKQDGITVVDVLHDKDSSTIKHVMEVFHDVKEELCVGHGCKNFKKMLLKQGKKHPQLKAIANRMSKALRFCIRTCNGDTENFKTEFNRRIQHYCNNHDLCNWEKHVITSEKRYVTDKKAQEILKVILVSSIHVFLCIQSSIDRRSTVD